LSSGLVERPCGARRSLPVIGSILFWTIGVKDKRLMFSKRTK
jgi:hypothetical protein